MRIKKGDNVIVLSGTKKPTRVGYEIVKGEKVRISKKSGAKIK